MKLELCSTCHGSGKVIEKGMGYMDDITMTCYVCMGTGTCEIEKPKPRKKKKVANDPETEA